MLATLASYDRFFGPVHIQTLSVAVVLAENLAESGEKELSRQLLWRVARDLTGAGEETHAMRARALALLNGLDGSSSRVC